LELTGIVAVLGRLDDEEVVSDLSLCMQILEERLEASISSIAYPRGRPRRDFSQREYDRPGENRRIREW